MPRSETPCVVGLAVRLPDRRNSWNPGTWRNASSAAGAAVTARSSWSRTTTLAGVSPIVRGMRAAVTVTSSDARAADKVTAISPDASADPNDRSHGGTRCLDAQRRVAGSPRREREAARPDPWRLAAQGVPALAAAPASRGGPSRPRSPRLGGRGPRRRRSLTADRQKPGRKGRPRRSSSRDGDFPRPVARLDGGDGAAGGDVHDRDVPRYAVRRREIVRRTTGRCPRGAGRPGWSPRPHGSPYRRRPRRSRGSW